LHRGELLGAGGALLRKSRAGFGTGFSASWTSVTLRLRQLRQFGTMDVALRPAVSPHYKKPLDFVSGASQYAPQ
jgi:hypothetical protein